MQKNKEEQLTIRDGFGQGLVQAASKNPQILAMSADLTSSVGMGEFSKRFPERFYQVGIAEQNMAGIAAGLALEGFTPFIGSFACFQPMRNLDQVRTSIAIMNAPVKLVSSHAGFSFGADGIQIQALEDVGIMRMLPNFVVLVPADAEQAASLVSHAVDNNSPTYIRLGRSKAAYLSQLYPKYQFHAGKIDSLQEGEDITLISMGYTSEIVHKAKLELEKIGVSVQVLNIHQLKPLDESTLIQHLSKTKKVVTVEEHQLAGGLGSLIAETITQNMLDIKLQMIGVQDEFGDTARDNQELWQARGLTVENIIKAANKLI